MSNTPRDPKTGRPQKVGQTSQDGSDTSDETYSRWKQLAAQYASDGLICVILGYLFLHGLSSTLPETLMLISGGVLAATLKMFQYHMKYNQLINEP